jgi:hypothetical protein
MINIRKSVFETNSSSVHSLIIQKDDWYNDKIDYTPYVIEGGYYGRCPQIPIENVEGKLKYIWTMVNDLWGLDFKSYLDADGNLLPSEEREVCYKNEIRFHRWRNKLQKMFPNAEFITIPVGNWDYGIDHVQGLTQFADDLENHPELLTYLLFAYSWIDIGGDEYANWPCILPYPWEELVDVNNNTVLYVKGN